MDIYKVNVENKLSQFSDYWNPRIVGELNGQVVKLVKLAGTFVWHKHDKEDELFYVIKGELKVEFRDKTIAVREKEFLIVPKGIEHRSHAGHEVWVMLFEPSTTINTGDNVGEMTKKDLERI